MRAVDPDCSRSSSGSWTVFATNVERVSRSRIYQRVIHASTSGTAAHANAPRASSSGSTKRSDRRMEFAFVPWSGTLDWGTASFFPTGLAPDQRAFVESQVGVVLHRTSLEAAIDVAPSNG